MVDPVRPPRKQDYDEPIRAGEAIQTRASGTFQTGTEGDSIQGRTVYRAWWETLPQSETLIRYTNGQPVTFAELAVAESGRWYRTALTRANAVALVQHRRLKAFPTALTSTTPQQFSIYYKP